MPRNKKGRAAVPPTGYRPEQPEEVKALDHPEHEPAVVSDNNVSTNEGDNDSDNQYSEIKKKITRKKVSRKKPNKEPKPKKLEKNSKLVRKISLQTSITDETWDKLEEMKYLHRKVKREKIGDNAIIEYMISRVYPKFISDVENKNRTKIVKDSKLIRKNFLNTSITDKAWDELEYMKFLHRRVNREKIGDNAIIEFMIDKVYPVFIEELKKQEQKNNLKTT